MQRLEEIRYPCIAAVHRHGVLGQIVSAETEEIGGFGKQIYEYCCSRRFDHYPYWDISSKFNGIEFQVLFHRFHDLSCASQFIQVRHHWEHDTDLVPHPRP